MPFCPAFLSLCCSVPGNAILFRQQKEAGNGHGLGCGRTTAEEVELQTDDKGNNQMHLQPKSSLHLQPQRGCLLHIVCIKYNLIFVYYQLVFFRESGNGSPMPQIELSNYSALARLSVALS